jgi:hypothetical protein
MSRNTTDTGRESGTGQDTPTGCVHVPPRCPLRLAGHSVTMSRPVPLSRIGGSPFISTVGMLAGPASRCRGAADGAEGPNAKCHTGAGTLPARALVPYRGVDHILRSTP